MEVMERLYNKGLLSYPRTETDKYSKTINVSEIASSFKYHPDPEISSYAANIPWAGPRNGVKDDKAHPPIHPVKSPTASSDLENPNEEKIFDLILRHFLASVSKDAVGE